MITLELLNTVAITFLATEIYFWHSQAPQDSDAFAGAASWLLYRRGRIIAALLLCNVIYLVSNGATTGASNPPVLEIKDLLGRLAYVVDELLLTSVLFCTIIYALLYALWKHHLDCRHDLSRRDIIAGYIVCFIGAYMTCWQLSLHLVLGITEAYLVKLWGAIIGFFIVCYLDVRQTTPLSLPAFMEVVAESMLFVTPMLPLAAVVISTFMFLAVSILENGLSVDPSFLNWPVYYGTLYGPFSLIYFRTKQTCRSLSQRQSSMV